MYAIPLEEQRMDIYRLRETMGILLNNEVENTDVMNLEKVMLLERFRA